MEAGDPLAGDEDRSVEAYPLDLAAAQRGGGSGVGEQRQVRHEQGCRRSGDLRRRFECTPAARRSVPARRGLPAPCCAGNLARGRRQQPASQVLGDVRAPGRQGAMHQPALSGLPRIRVSFPPGWRCRERSARDRRKPRPRLDALRPGLQQPVRPQAAFLRGQVEGWRPGGAGLERPGGAGMILQSLNDYYARKAADPEGSLAPEGFEPKAIPFVLVLDGSGRLIQLADQRQSDGKKKVAKPQFVPQGVKKQSGIAANLLWDTAEYVLSIDTRGKPERVAEQHRAFIARLEETLDKQPHDAGLRAVYAFLRTHKPAALEKLAAHPCWPEILDTNPLMKIGRASCRE